MRERVVSGLRPTGKVHIGHLVGALSKWAELQEAYECFFFAADWHALSTEYKNTGIIQESIVDNVTDWIACGIDPDRSVIFVQSAIKEHAELFLILSMITPISWLERNPTHKEQLQELKDKDIANLGFLGYPVLQTADIAIYGGKKVPVGEDQLPHLEMGREIVRRFNFLYGETLVEMEAVLSPTPRLLGLDGRKMSKSYGNFIALSDDEETIRKKVTSMFTDPQRIKLATPGRPEVCNVHTYYSVFHRSMKDACYEWCTGAKVGCVECKRRLADGILTALSPIVKKRRSLTREYVRDVLEQGNKRAREEAQKTMEAVRKAVKL